MSIPPPPAPTASAIGPCPTVIKVVGRPGTGCLPSTIAPPDHPPPRGKKDSTKRHHHRHHKRQPGRHHTTSDSQVNSNFPNRWSPASLTFNNYFYLFLYLYITWITTNNNAPHLKSPKNQSRRAALGRPAIKITGGLQLVFGRPTLALSSALVPQTLSCLVCVEDS